MRRCLLPVLVLFGAFGPLAGAQDAAPGAIHWVTAAVPVKTTGERLFRLEFTGRIAPGYIVYGSDFEAELGPNPTRLRFTTKEGVTARDALKSAGTKKGKDPAFNTDYTYFQGEARLSQLVAVAPDVKQVAGTIRGQTCYEADGTCQLFTAPFEIALP